MTNIIKGGHTQMLLLKLEEGKTSTLYISIKYSAALYDAFMPSKLTPCGNLLYTMNFRYQFVMQP